MLLELFSLTIIKFRVLSWPFIKCNLSFIIGLVETGMIFHLYAKILSTEIIWQFFLSYKF